MKIMKFMKVAMLMLILTFGMADAAYAQCGGMGRMRGHRHMRMRMRAHHRRMVRRQYRRHHRHD